MSWQSYEKQSYNGYFKIGPLKGLQISNRMYTLDLRQDIFIGSIHFIDGNKVNINFPGQRKFCYKISWECPGNGVAKECQAKSDVRTRIKV